MGLISTNISDLEITCLKNMRWRCRTDLFFLCSILGFKDVTEKVHGSIVNSLPKFKLPPKDQADKIDIIRPGYVEYIPWYRPEDLPGKHRILLLHSRGSLKTTINAVAHNIQFIINFPESSQLIFQSTSEKSKEIMRQIKEAFQFNETFRQIFPDLVPQQSIRDWGNKSSFTAPSEEIRARRIEKYKLRPSKESTVVAISIDEGTAGKHVDLVTYSDIVEPTNVRTENQLADVIHAFRMSHNLLVSPKSLIKVEGTRYHYADLYGNLITSWMGDDGIKTSTTDYYRKTWTIHVRGAWEKDYSLLGKDYIPKYTPDELELPEKIVDGKFVSYWPERFTVEDLEQEREDDPMIFATQKLNDPRKASDKMIFPLDQGLWIEREDFRKIPIYEHTVTVDTAEKTGEKNDYSVVCVCAWDGDGRCYLHDVRVGKYEPSELLDHIFDVNTRYRPSKILIEEVGYVIGLKVEIQRRQDMKGIFLPIEFIRKTKTMNKKDRIKNTLQPVWKNKWIRVVKFDKKDELQKKYPFHHLFTRQCEQFPKSHDDILDALTDQFHGRTHFGRNIARPDDNDYYKNSDGTFTEAGVNYLLNEGTKAFPTIQDKLMQQFLYPDPETANGKVIGNRITGLL